MKKVITTILLSVFLCQLYIPFVSHATYTTAGKKISVYDVTVSTMDTSKECVRKWNVILADMVHRLPVYIRNQGPVLTVGTVNYGFNFTLWDDKNIAVYGEAEDIRINPRKDKTSGFKDFKTKTDDADCTEYYLYNGQKGEFRYHGYDVNKNLYSNTDFPLDTPRKNINSYNWTRFPWDYKLCTKSDWNKTADQRKDSTEAQYVYNWISKLYEDEATGTSLFDFSKSSDKDVLVPYTGNPNDYANVQSAPTLKYPGEAKLWHWNSGWWYYATSIQPIGDKIWTPLSMDGTVTEIKTLEKKDPITDSVVEARVRLNAILDDGIYYSSDVLSTVYYTRLDIKGGTEGWNFTLGGSVEKSKGGMKVENKGNATFTVRTTLGAFTKRANGVGTMTLPATATVIAQNGQTKTVSKNVTITTDIPKPQPPDPVPAPKFITPNIDIPDPAFDIVPHPCKDNTIYKDADGASVNIVEKRVFVDGTRVDYNYFFSGSYIFGETGADRLSNIIVEYKADDGNVSKITRWIRVLNTKPRVQYAISSTYRQNRRFAATNTSTAANTPEVINKYPITSYQWTIEALTGDPASIRTGTSTDSLREYTFKKPGTYRLTLVGKNTLNRTSDPYAVDFEILQDIPAAVICQLDNVKVSRGETIGAYAFEAASTDGDSIDSTNIKLYYDSNNDGTPDTLEQAWNNVQNGAFPAYTVSKLGMYRYVIESTENPAGDLIPGHTDATDKTIKVLERDFWCDNNIPMTGLYVNIPIVRPNIDTFILMDENLDGTKVNYIKNSRMDFNNYLRSCNILPVVENWDLHTYTYTQPGNTTLNTGGAYPPATTVYTSNGYSGILNLSTVSDNGTNVDYGSWQTRTEYKTATGTGSGSASIYWKHTQWGWVEDGRNESSKSSIPYSDGEGYSGTLYQTSFTLVYDSGPPSGGKNGDTYTQSKTYSASYSGTVSRTVTVWISNWVWVSNYTGFYNGTLSKQVKQPCFDPFRPTSDKYIIYVSDGNIANLTDVKNVVNKSGAKLILIGQESAKAQITHTHFILNNRPIADIMKDALDHIAASNPAIESYYVLAGLDTFSMNTDDFDQEGDPIVSQQYQYVQDANFFDNSLGMAAYATTQYSDTNGWMDFKPDRFNLPGKYTIYRRIQDQPTKDPNFANYNYYSGTPMLIVYAHRKPIASATLDWDYSTSASAYLTTWKDQSYDPDHQYTRDDKGIAERKIMFRQTGGEWSYTIPDRLVPGTYELLYYVKDIEGAWSDPFVMNFTLNNAPPMQLDAKARTLDSRFSLKSIPTSEYLELYEVWTRYPFKVSLEAALYRGAARVAPVKTVDFSAATGSKTNNDIRWNNISYLIPSTLPDGNYTFRITANGEYGQTQSIDFPVTVDTPIQLEGAINGKVSKAEIYPNESTSFTFNTSIYVSSVRLNFKGVTYTSDAGDISLRTSSGGRKTWEIQMNLSEDVLRDGETGYAAFTAIIPSGKQEMKTVDYRVIAMQLKNLRITQITDFAWKSIFQNCDSISTGEMPVFRNNGNAYVSLGYKVKFKIDSIGLNAAADWLTVKACFFALDSTGHLQPADIYIENALGDYDLLSESSYWNRSGEITLNSTSRALFENDPAKANNNTWSFDYYLPYSAKVVKQGEILDPYKDNTIKTKLLVAFEVTGHKASSGVVYDYTAKESAWGSNSNIPYGFNRPSGSDLLGKGVNHGEVFWYDLKKTAQDDIKIERTW